jgi:hypothetical protein
MSRLRVILEGMLLTKESMARMVVVGAAAVALAIPVAAGATMSTTYLADPCVGHNDNSCGPGGVGASVPGANANAGPGGASATVPGANAIAGPSGVNTDVPGANANAGPGGASASVPGANANAGPGGANFCVNGFCINAG